VGAWKLDAPLAGPPVGVEGEAFVTDLAGGVMAFGRDGRRSWAVNLGAAVVGRPVIAGDRVSFVTRDGTFHVRSRKDGALIEKLALGILPAGGLIVADGLTCVSSGRGSVRALLRPKATEGVR
jgi:outer membrane protein assembly factor BamB